MEKQYEETLITIRNQYALDNHGLPGMLVDIERQAIVEAMQVDGNVDRVAVLLGIGRTTVYRRLRELSKEGKASG